jgi:polysaccharide deacetylase family protein (PEP-CTERM system associated)
VLGWVCERFPELIKEAALRGHEIASHGYFHRLVYHMSPAELYEDLVRSKDILEDTVGRPVVGYRAPGFSVTTQVPWFFETLADAGYRYDSSVFPASRTHGGMKIPYRGPYWVGSQGQGVIEFPIAVAPVLGQPVCFFGGGYLRLFPYKLVKWMARRVLADSKPLVLYVHPADIDPSQPRLAMNAKRRFQSYVNLGGTETKIRSFLRDFECCTFAHFIEERLTRPVAGIERNQYRQAGNEGGDVEG